MRTFASWSVTPTLGGPVTADAAENVVIERVSVEAPGARQVIRTLRAARAALVERPVREVAAVLGSVGRRFLDPADELRREALELVPPTAGVSAQMAARTLDGMASDWRAERLETLLDLELQGGAALDGFVVSAVGRKSRALGAPFTVHVCAGTVPGVSVTSLVRGLLVKSAVLLKPGRGDVVLPVLFRRGLEEADPPLAAASAVVYWPGGAGETLESIVLADADLVVVYGGEESVRAVRGRVAGTTPVVVYPHRVSLGVVGGAALDGQAGADAAVADAARAVALFDQRGCVSPHLFYVIGDEGAAERFAEALATRLELLERELPSGPLDDRSAAELQQLRGTAEVLSAAGRGTLWRGEGTTWTVIWNPDPAFEPSCLGRTVRVKAIRSVDELLRLVGPYYRHLQTVGVAGLDAATLSSLGEGLARLGPTRVAPLDSAPWPPPWWHHDGMGPLTSLLRWSDLEEG